MTDNSYGDYHTKNPLKNPLLSTAVTGLSISDLTQNAVLLPVAQSQEQIIAQEPQNVTQDRTLTNIDQNPLNLPSGDPNSNTLASNVSNINNPSILSQKQNVANDRIHDLYGSTLPKPSSKSEDDFDFNEYFARLQGTRYVSAPVNSLLKEDQNANLETAEENLEEINLNESSKSQNDYDSQQSITADIAQNFSQLPTVLPQVASAVFSSFSSMLNLKSREQTPDNNKPYPEHQEQPTPPQKAEELTVPLIGIGAEVKEVAPPPKELSKAGFGSYRITTKKKAYAQIPGLTSGDNVREVHYNSPSSNNSTSLPPSYFIPSPGDSRTLSTDIYNIQHTVEQKWPADKINIDFDSSLNEKKLEAPNIHNSIQPNPCEWIPVTKDPECLLPSKPNEEQNVLPESNTQSQINELGQDASAAFIDSSLSQGSIIPPPPMFSNLPKPDNLASTTGRTILPPSIARRISANNPIIRPHSRHNTLPLQNIFVPTTISGNESSMSSYNETPLIDSACAAGAQNATICLSSTLSVTQTHCATNLSSDEAGKIHEGLSSFVNPSQAQMSFLGTGQFISSLQDISPAISTNAEKAYPFSATENDVRQHNTNTFHSENIQPLPQPPKLPSGNMNFRMTKKRPQYYSGPIAGVGEISNHIKPAITPVSTNIFQGTVYTPDQQFKSTVLSEPTNSFEDTVWLPPEQVDTIGFKSYGNASQVDQTTESFYVNKSVEQAPLYPAYDKFQNNGQDVFNTPFDVSRDPSESYNDYGEATKSFGIIGSLKSKLSSIDINKIQNSVTTFFDPAYNNAKIESQKQEKISFENYHNLEFPDAGSYKTDNFEIFVPQAEPQSQLYNYPTGNQNMYFNDEEKNQNVDFSCYPNQVSSSFSLPESQTDTYPVFDAQQPIDIFAKAATQEPRILDSIQKEPEKDLTTNNDIYLSHHELNKSYHKGIFGEKTKNSNESISRHKTAAQIGADSLYDTQDDKSTVNNIREQYSEEKRSFITDTPSEDRKDTDDGIELNICETCREVNKSEIKEPDGLTAQLIENITAPIQLSNAVEVPLTECNTPLEERNDFNPDQYAEISHITEETIETLNVQSATELLDDVNELASSKVNSYGWSSTTENTFTPKENIEQNYSFQLKADSVELVADSSLFFENVPNNASDEIKAELKNHEDHLVILPRQMSTPTAPPEEFDESNSDKTGVLDVQSIEQDAKRDFPIFEEFIIEPSETDDDKIECRERKRSSEDSTLEKDTFTNRVEKFKKMEGTYFDTKNHNTLDQSNKIQLFDLATTNNTTIPIASYFDTGNYAAESHYRNSITSMTTLSAFNAPSEIIRIPPGFEEEFESKLSFDTSQNVDVNMVCKDDKDVGHVPETTTQTKLLESITFTMAQTVDNQQNTLQQQLANVREEIKQDEAIVFDDKNNLIQSKSYEEKVLDDNLQNIGMTFDDSKYFSCEVGKNIKESDIFTTHVNTLASDTFEHDQASQSENIPENILAPKGAEDVKPQFCSIFSTKPELTGEENTPILFDQKNSDQDSVNDHLALVEDAQSLPDPINFFSSNTNETNDSFNRLASYFTAPPKPDHSKSFFELSQSQDHYRHNNEPYPNFRNVMNDQDNKGITSNNNELNKNENQTFNKDMYNMPSASYLANLDLINDLTSYKNYKPKEPIVTTVNFLTVEYNTNLNTIPYLKPDSKKINYDLNKHNAMKTDSYKCKVSTDLELKETLDAGNEMQLNIIQYCVYCCNIGVCGLKNSDNLESYTGLEYSKIKKSMDGQNSESVKEKDIGVGQNKSSGNKKSTGVSFNNLTLDEETNDNMSTNTENRPAADYTPVKYHWFYRVDFEDKSTWRGFSTVDSDALENAFNSPDLDESTVVATDGGRFDVNVVARLRVAVYWSDKPSNVRRCSWFYKGTTDVRYVPYTEEMAEKLEEEYRHGITTGEWHRRLVLDDSELVVMHGPTVMVHFLQGATHDAFNGPNQATMRPRVVRRGFDDTEIEEIEPSNIDHLLLMCHGVGSACDMRFRSVEEVVDDFRATSLQLIQSHYRNSYESGRVNRVEVLPISWHSTLHSGENGVDGRLAQVTLDSIPRLRNFTNDTVLDVLFYTSPIYSQTIVDTVCSELNRIYALFKKRNPNFTGGVSLGGHSLGSVILYDLLCHQEPDPTARRESNSNKEYVSTSARMGQPNVKYPKLSFYPDAMYGLGSPIAIFECIRGVDHLGPTFGLPTCKNFFNIFHPYDPIAYRIEPLINPQLKNVKPFLIPHHKGRKRMHLELKDTMVRVGADLKQKLLESLKTTWYSMWRTEAEPPSGQLEKVVDEELEKQNLTEKPKEETHQRAELTVTPEMCGKLNAGRRIDYVLQEAPFEMINEYLFAMSSHVCYWESEDTMLMMLREIYDGLGIQPDSTVPQQSMTVERSRAAEDELEAATTSAYML